jgi:hypothetical protein
MLFIFELLCHIDMIFVIIYINNLLCICTVPLKMIFDHYALSEYYIWYSFSTVKKITGIAMAQFRLHFIMV